METFLDGKQLAADKKLKPLTPPPRMGSEAYNSSEAAALEAAASAK